MRTAYHRGRDLEYRVAREFRSAGYTVVRSAGSHTPFDLVVLSPRKVLLVQCGVKTNRNMQELSAKYPRYMVVWVRNKERGIYEWCLLLNGLVLRREVGPLKLLPISV